jgi:hypothetical protein
VVCATLTAALAGAAEREDRWRLAEDGDQLHLYIANTDEGTDHIGSPWFRCNRASGTITVGANMDDREREAFADLIMRDADPFIEMIPATPNQAFPATISHSPMYGWQYTFGMPADAPAFSNFTRTGVLEFKVGEFVLRSEFAVGLDKTVMFQRACRNQASR